MARDHTYLFPIGQRSSSYIRNTSLINKCLFLIDKEYNQQRNEQHYYLIQEINISARDVYLSLIEWIQFFNKIALNKMSRRKCITISLLIINIHLLICVSPINRNKTSKIKFIKSFINGISNQQRNKTYKLGAQIKYPRGDIIELFINTGKQFVEKNSTRQEMYSFPYW